jgi:hypothetical protein
LIRGGAEKEIFYQHFSNEKQLFRVKIGHLFTVRGLKKGGGEKPSKHVYMR